MPFSKLPNLHFQVQRFGRISYQSLQFEMPEHQELPRFLVLSFSW